MTPGDPYRSTTRELLVRYLDGCAPSVLHSARRLTYAELGGPGDDPSAVAALGALAEFRDLLATRALRVVLTGADPAGQRAVRAARDSLAVPCELTLDDRPLLPALRAAGSFGAPILAFAEPPTDAGTDGEGLADLLAALAGNPGSDILLVVGGSGDPGACRTAGFTHSVAVGLTAPGHPDRMLLFGTNTDRHLDAVKDALWAADEYAGVRYREPADPDGTALDISLSPGLGPLRRLLLARLRERPRTLGELRAYTRACTIYRAAEAPRAVTAMLRARQAGREPEHGRLSADTLIHAG
jgi:hypothetical protein